MTIIPWIQNSAEVLWSRKQTEKNNTEYQKEQDKASNNLPKDNKNFNNTFYKKPSNFSKLFWETLKEFESNPEEIKKASLKTWYKKEEWQSQEDFIDELAEKLIKLKIEKDENLVEEWQDKNTEWKIESAISQDKVEFTRDKILSRLDMWDENKKNNISKNLDNPENRKENFEKAKTIFFWKEQLIEDIKWNDSLLKFSGNIFKKEWNGVKIVDDDLENILWNFVTNIEWINFSELDDWSQIEAKNVLNDCFELEINELLDWKNTNNYNTTAIEEMKSEILDDNIIKNPLEKLQKFKELKLSLQTSIASKFVKTEKLLKNKDTKQLKSERNTLAKLYNNLKNSLDKIFVNTSKNKVLKNILENYKTIEKTIKWWEVMWWWEIEKNKTWTEKK